MTPCWLRTSVHTPAAVDWSLLPPMTGQSDQSIEIRPPGAWDDHGMPTTAARTLANYVGGAFADAAGEEALDTRNPFSGELLARVPLSTQADVDRATAAARTAQRDWGGTSPVVRARHVFALRETLDRHREELARIVTTDMGKTYPDALAEVGRGIES